MAISQWRPTKLDELGFVGRGKSRHRPRNAAFLYGGRYPFFQTGDIKAANFYLTAYSQTYSEDGLAQSKLWKPGTLCITIAANIAESAILGIEGCFPDSVVGFVADPTKADVRFIKYYLEILKLRMQNISHGATQDNLSVDKLLSFDFLVPPPPHPAAYRGHPVGLRRADRKQPAADQDSGVDGPRPLPRVVRPLPLPRP